MHSLKRTYIVTCWPFQSSVYCNLEKKWCSLTDHDHHPTATLSKLEALRVSHEGVIENLRSQISGLQQRIGQLEEERETLLSSQRTSGEQQTSRIRALEKVCG